MTRTSLDNVKYLGGALGVHALLVLLLVGAALIQPRPIQPSLSLQAVMVDSATLAQLAKRSTPDESKEIAKPVPESTPEPPTKVEQKPIPPDAAELERQQQALKQEQLTQQAQQMKAQLQKEQEIALAKQAEAEKQKQLDAQRKAAEEKQRQQKLADQQRVAEIQQKQRDAELKNQIEADARAQKSREAELAAQLAAEEGRATAVNAGLLNQYVALIQQKVMRNWIKPPTAKAGLECEVKVTQASGGMVLSVAVGRCNGDPAVRNSIEAAVNAASPLPMPPDARLFDRNLAFIFKPVD